MEPNALMEFVKESLALEEQQRFSEAIECIDEGLRLAHGRSEFRCQAATLARHGTAVCLHAGRLDKALDHCREAIACDETAYDHWEMGFLLTLLKNEELAAKHFERFAELANASGDPDLLELLAAHRK